MKNKTKKPPHNVKRFNEWILFMDLFGFDLNGARFSFFNFRDHKGEYTVFEVGLNIGGILGRGE